MFVLRKKAEEYLLTDYRGVTDDEQLTEYFRNLGFLKVSDK